VIRSAEMGWFQMSSATRNRQEIEDARRWIRRVLDTNPSEAVLASLEQQTDRLDKMESDLQHDGGAACRELQTA